MADRAGMEDGCRHSVQARFGGQSIATAGFVDAFRAPGCTRERESELNEVVIYTDGACKGQSRSGGGCVLQTPDGHVKELSAVTRKPPTTVWK